MQRKRTRELRVAFYQLKKAYGFKVTLCRRTSSGFDFETGKETNVTTFKVIKKAVLLPATLAEDSEIRSSERDMLLDWQDIKIIGVEVNDFILFDAQSWIVSKIEDYELKTIKKVRIKHTVGDTYLDPLGPDVTTTMSSTQEITDA